MAKGRVSIGRALRHFFVHAFGLATIVMFLALLTAVFSVGQDVTDGLIGAASAWVIHLMLSRIDVDDDPSIFAAAVAAMAWAARTCAQIVVPSAIFVAVYAGLWELGRSPFVEQVGAWIDTPALEATYHTLETSARDVARIVTGFFALAALGGVIEMLHVAVLVSLMTRNAAPWRRATTVLRTRRAARRELRRTIHGLGEVTPSPAAKHILARNHRARIASLRTTCLAILAMFVPIAAFHPYALSGAPDPTVLDILEFLAFALVVLALFTLRGLGTRTPFRQVRVALGATIALFAVSIVGMLSLLAPLGLFTTSRSRHWHLVSRAVSIADHALISRHGYIALMFIGICLGFDPREDLFGAPLALTLWFLGIAAYAAVHVTLRRVDDATRAAPVHLILLRVFGDSDRAGFLMERVVPMWRGIGNVATICAPDTASYTLDTSTVAHILFGQLRNRFGDDPAVRDAAIQDHLGDDHSGQSQQFLCYDDTWRETLQRFLDVDAVILMDLRGFGPTNAGCAYELGQLADRVPVDRVILLTDDTTDPAMLDSSLAEAWHARSTTSPNADLPFGEVNIAAAADSDDDTTRHLRPLLAEAAARIDRTS